MNNIQAVSSSIHIRTDIPLPPKSLEYNYGSELDLNLPIGGSALLFGIDRKKMYIRLKRLDSNKLYSIRKEFGGFRIFRIS